MSADIIICTFIYAGCVTYYFTLLEIAPHEISKKH